MDRHCGKVIEAQPTLGQIGPSEAAWAPRGQTARRLDDRWPPFGKRRTTLRAQSRGPSHQRRQNGGTNERIPSNRRRRCHRPGKKLSNASREYLSVKLDDPTFAAPRFFTCVVAAGDEEGRYLVSPKRCDRAGQATASAQEAWGL